MFLIFKPFSSIRQNPVMVMRKKLILPVLFILFCAISHAQSLGWMMGTWKGTGGIIQIDDVSGGSFSGTKTSGINNHKITTAISGAFRGRGLYLEDGEVLRGEGQPTSQGYDCSACTPVTKIVIKQDSLVLVNSISNCDEKCNGETFFTGCLLNMTAPRNDILLTGLEDLQTSLVSGHAARRKIYRLPPTIIMSL